MDFDPLFEDLEARFDAEANAANQGFSLDSLEGATSVRLHLTDGQRQSLIAPMLGLGFVAGIQPDDRAWTLVPLGAIHSLDFDFTAALTLPILKIQKLQISEHLEQLQFPARCSFRTFNPDVGQTQATVLGVGQELLFVQILGAATLLAIPLVRLSQLQIWPVDNSSKDF